MDLNELQSYAAKAGCVLLPAPHRGFVYVEQVAVNRSVLMNADGETVSKYRKEKKQFAKFYDEVWEAIGLKKALNPNEIYCLTLLFPYCETNTNFLVDKSLRRNPLDLSDIARIIDREERQTKRILKSLTGKNMIAKIDSGYVEKYCINPELYWSGGDMREHKVFSNMFYTYKESIIKKAREQVEEVKRKFPGDKEKKKEAEKNVPKTVYVNNRKTSLLYQ